MSLKIIVEEEYGFKYWIWTVDDGKSFNDVYSILKKAIDGEFYSGLSNGGLPGQFNFGKWEEVEWKEYREYTLGDKRKEADAFAHLHTQDDSWIEESDNVQWHDGNGPAPWETSQEIK